MIEINKKRQQQAILLQKKYYRLYLINHGLPGLLMGLWIIAFSIIKSNFIKPTSLEIEWKGTVVFLILYFFFSIGIFIIIKTVAMYSLYKNQQKIKLTKLKFIPWYLQRKRRDAMGLGFQKLSSLRPLRTDERNGLLAKLVKQAECDGVSLP